MIHLAALLALLAPQDLKPPLEDPKDVLKGVKAPAGWTVSLFAAPPNVGYPVCLAAAPDGTLFVGVDENGSIDAKPGRGRILRCSDTDGDGRADRIVVFADGIDSPRGLAWDGRTLFVLHPPFLRALRDEDGDGRAEKSEVLVSGIGFDLKFRGADHTTNGIQRGIDGWIYVAVGDYGFVKATGLDGKSVQLYGGGIARVRPDGTELEVVADGLRNVYDVAVSPRLDLFTRDNTNDGGGWNVRLSHIVPTAHYGYPTLFKNFAEDILPALADYGGGSPCGSHWIDEPGIGDALFTCDWGRSAIYRHPLPEQGASFKAAQEPFLEMNRPTDMDVDGEGRIYAASWRNGGFTYSGPNVGYVLRAVPPSGRATWTDLRKVPTADLAAALAGPGQVRRLQAQSELLRRPDRASAAGAVAALLAAPDAATRTAAAFTLKQLQGPASHAALLARLPDEAALRALADRRAETKDLPFEPVAKALGSPDARVRLQAAIALGRIGRTEAASALIPALADADPAVAHAARNALVALRPREALLKALDAGDGRVLKVLQALHDPETVDALIARLPKGADKPAVLRTLCRLHFREHDWDGRWWGTRPDTRGPYFKPVAWDGTTRIAAALKAELAAAQGPALRTLLADLQRHRILFEEAVALVLKAAAEDPALRLVAVEMFAEKGGAPPEGAPIVEALALDPAADGAARLRALSVLNRSGMVDASVRVLTQPKLPGELNQARDEFVRDARHAKKIEIFQKLAASEAAPARELGLAVLASLAGGKNTPKDAREAAQKGVEAALAGADAALALRGIALAKAEPFAPFVRNLAADPRADVREAAKAAVRALKLDAGADGRKILKGLTPDQVRTAVAAETGDPKLGADLFTRQGCVVCHTVTASQPPKGPFLGDIAARYKREELLESILVPNAKIAQGFATHWFETKEEDRYEGFVVRESGDEVEIRTVAGVAITLKLAEVAKRGQLETSIMPVGLVEPLTAKEFASLLDYLGTLKSK